MDLSTACYAQNALDVLLVSSMHTRAYISGTISLDSPIRLIRIRPRSTCQQQMFEFGCFSTEAILKVTVSEAV